MQRNGVYNIRYRDGLERDLKMSTEAASAYFPAPETLQEISLIMYRAKLSLLTQCLEMHSLSVRGQNRENAYKDLRQAMYGFVECKLTHCKDQKAWEAKGAELAAKAREIAASRFK